MEEILGTLYGKGSFLTLCLDLYFHPVNCMLIALRSLENFSLPFLVGEEIRKARAQLVNKNKYK